MSKPCGRFFQIMCASQKVWALLLSFLTMAEFWNLASSRYYKGALTQIIYSALYYFQVWSTKKVDKVLPTNLKRGKIISGIRENMVNNSFVFWEKRWKIILPSTGLELTTPGMRVQHSTNWAMGEIYNTMENRIVLKIFLQLCYQFVSEQRGCGPSCHLFRALEPT